MATVKFMYNGIKVDGKLYKGAYSKGGYNEHSGLLEDTITIYAKLNFPKIEGLEIENETDVMTDYFDTDDIRVNKENPFYKEVHAAYEKQEEKMIAANEKRKQKRMEKKAVRV